MKFYAGIFIFIFCVEWAGAQTFSTVQFKWTDSLKTVRAHDGLDHNIPWFNGASVDEDQFGLLPVYEKQIHPGAGSDFSIQLINEQWLPAASIPDNFTNEISEKIKSDFQCFIYVGEDRGINTGQIIIVPLRVNSQGQLEKLVSCNVQITKKNSSAITTRTPVYATNSVLANGNWYKIAVKQDGVYKLDKNFLQSIGINTDGIDPRNIRIYGNGGGMLPELNSAFRYDDLQENAIEVMGEDDGKFDPGDYVLFYGESPDRWTYDTANHRFVHHEHLYSKYTYYFITTDLGPGKRIQAQNSETQSPTVSVNDFNDYAVHEIDQNNFLKSGRIWYGEPFEFQPSQDFSFNFPNTETNVKGSMVATLISQSLYAANTFTLSSNGAQVGSVSIASTGGDYTNPYANSGSIAATFLPDADNLNVNLNYTRNAIDAAGWLDYLEVNVMRRLSWTGTAFNFRNASVKNAGSIAQYNLSNAPSDVTIWDVTDPINVANQNYNLSGSTASFSLATDGNIHEFFAFESSQALTPVNAGKVANQDLHGMPPQKLYIVTTALLQEKAQELADFHNASGLTSTVVLLPQIYNEFSSGAPDISAIRDFMRMVYKRANGDSSLMPKYLLLFGDGSYDNKGNNPTEPGDTSIVPTYESVNSLDPIESYTSDDFYGFLDDNEGSMDNPAAKLDLGIGRIPVNTTDQADAVINKIKVYASPQSLGDWRNIGVLVADDQEGGAFVFPSENIYNKLRMYHPAFNINKIYLDAYQVVAVPGGFRYPDAETAIFNQVNNGTMFINYDGHGGATGWANERVLQPNDINAMTNLTHLSLFITATCDFSVYDNPDIVSAGEQLLLNPNGGAIALVSTVRLVFNTENDKLDSSFIDRIFLRENGYKPGIGEIYRIAKNVSGSDANNCRKFALIGDPALPIDYPEMNVVTSEINNAPVGSDTVKALQHVTIKGAVTDLEGDVLQNFNGVVYPTVYDKPATYHTLGNNGSPVLNFQLQNNIIYKGLASVKNGLFTFSFVVPKDISYTFGNGKISYYATDNVIDANGSNNGMIVGGNDDTATSDVEGPQISLYMNNENFIDGGITDPNPTLLVKLFDVNGINTTGTSIGHDITGVLDYDTKNTLYMNDYYTSDLDSYQSGEVNYPLSNISDGKHVINVKAFDVYNNSASDSIHFVVLSGNVLHIEDLMNFPNPFSDQTSFSFEHNLADQVLAIQIQIFNEGGGLVKTIEGSVGPLEERSASADNGLGSYRETGIVWDGRGDSGAKVANGLYIYRLIVKSQSGMQSTASGKLLILR